MRVLLHGADESLQAALRERGLELASDAPADALLTLGPPPALQPLAEIGPEEWTARFRVRVEEPFWAFQAWLRALLERGARGRWVAVTTTLGAQPFPGGGADGAAAVALQTLVRIAAIEYGARGLRANAIAAGWQEGELPAELDPALARSDTPTGRLGSAADLAGTVAWLLSADADQVNGEVLRLDGGYTISRGARPDPGEAVSVQELAPGIHRIESDLGVRSMAQYLLLGEERSVLVDTGLAGTPDEVLIPALDAARVEPDVVLISHADVDHSGGNRRIRERYPRALFACHELDRRWIESDAAMLAENYSWHVPYGLDGPDAAAMLALLGGDAPIDVGLQGEGTIRIGPGRRFELLHLPGHTPGHVGLWDAANRVALVVDAALGDGVYDREGTRLIPPRYYDAEGYRATIRRIRALEPALLLTAHYDPMDAAAARAFCDHSLAHVDRVEAIVRQQLAAGEVRLRELTAAVNARLGPYPEFTSEIAAGVRSHLGALGPPVTPLG